MSDPCRIIWTSVALLAACGLLDLALEVRARRRERPVRADNTRQAFWFLAMDFTAVFPGYGSRAYRWCLRRAALASEEW